MGVRFGVLGPVVAWHDDGRKADLRGPRHRAVLARLLVARGRVVPVSHLVDDLWVAPPDGAIPAIRTFVAALRRALEPDRPPRSRPTTLVTEGPGYALRAAPSSVDAWRFEEAVTAGGPLGEALGWWRGPAYADFPDAPWTRAERARLTELRLRAVELQAARLLAENRPADAIPQLDAHVTDHPWREEGWRLLALALYRTDRPGDALAVLRRARKLLSSRLGLDPGPALSRLELDILRREEHLDLGGPGDVALPAAMRSDSGGERRSDSSRDGGFGLGAGVSSGSGAWASSDSSQGDGTETSLDPRQGDDARTSSGLGPGDGAGASSDPRRGDAAGPSVVPSDAGGRAGTGDGGPAELWSTAAEAYDRLIGSGTRARLETAVGLLRSLAVSGGGDGLGAAQDQRLATIRAAEELGDPILTARVIGAYDVPAIWPRSDDPDRAAEVVAAARRALEALTANPIERPPSSEVAPPRPAREGHDLTSSDAPPERDPASGAGGSVASVGRTAGKRGPAAGASERARLLATIAVESRGSGAAEDREAAEEAVRIARRLEDPGLLAFALNGLFMQTFHRCGLAAERDAIGVELIGLAARHGLPSAEVLGHLIRVQTQCALGDPDAAAVHAEEAAKLAARHELPLVAVFVSWFDAMRAAASGADATAAYRVAESMLDRAGMPGLTASLAGTGLGEPPRDPMAEIVWCRIAEAAVARGDRATAIRARDALRPAAGEYAANGLLTMGPIRDVLAGLDRYIDV